MPADKPVRTPADTDTVVLLALHAPPAAVSLSTTEEPTHSAAGPVIIPAAGMVSIVMALVTVVVPHKLVTPYSIVSRPGDIPVTSPLAVIVAVELVTLQVPPAVSLVYKTDAPRHIVEEPRITPG